MSKTENVVKNVVKLSKSDRCWLARQSGETKRAARVVLVDAYQSIHRVKKARVALDFMTTLKDRKVAQRSENGKRESRHRLRGDALATV